MTNKLLPHLSIDSGKNPQHAVIWLHGLGADGYDFAPIVDELNIKAPVRFILPHAPKQAVTINGGFIMPAWYDIRDTQIDSQQDEAGINASQLAIEAFIQQQVESGIPEQNIFLAGFSQGGAIALHTALRQNKPLAGVLALSTYLPLAEQAKAAHTTASLNTPIMIAHGRYDNVVPMSLGKKSHEQLQQLGYPCDWFDYGMEHSVCPQEVIDIQNWLNTRIAP